MTDRQDHRSWWSTALISFFGGVFGGFLWIGAGKFALASLALLAACITFFCYYGLPALPQSAWFGTYSTLVFSLLSVAIVLPFRTRFKAHRWYSSGYSVFGFAFLGGYLLAFLIRSFLLQPFSIPSHAMTPTLQVGDHLFVSKTAYGYSRYSVPFGLLPIEGRIFGAEPVRGDVVVFKLPSEPHVDYIKRIVGLPGDKIQIVKGVLQIDGVAVKLEDVGVYSDDETKSVTMQRETLPNGASHYVLNLTDTSLGDDTALFEVPPGHYFMLGDNRDNSNDSRFTVGMVPYENFVGKAVRLFWNANGTEYKSRQVLD